MSSTSRRFIVAYVLLVCGPLAALIGVLKVGRTLTAPLSIDGVWTVDVNPSTPPADPCDQAASVLFDSPLVVSQSGKHLEITFKGASQGAVPAELDGTDLRASLRPSGCASAQVVKLVASVDPKSQPRALTGSLAVSNCASCAPLEFRAVRQTKSPSGAAH
jgi:hypothetical protein